MSEKSALLLFPNLLGEHKYHSLFLPASIDKAVQTIDGLIAESEREGRRYLSRFQLKKPLNLMPIALLNEHTPETDIDFLLQPIRQGERWGLISDAGIPCVADPGNKLVFRAKQLGIAVQAFVGPSSIILSLMLSGLPGQKFTFHGYLERDTVKKQQQIKLMEKQSDLEKYTHIFIEAPYRNQQTLEILVNTLSENTFLSIAWELTLPSQGVLTQTVAQWKKNPLPNLDKKNAIFLFNVGI